MGWGDDILLTSYADRQCNFGGYWSPIFEGNPFITRDQGEFIPRHERYRAGRTPERLVYNEHHRPKPGRLCISRTEWRWAGERVTSIPAPWHVIEPHVKAGFNGRNKDWGWDRWTQLKGNFVQLGPDGTRPLPGAHRIVTPTIRHALAVLAWSHGVITTDGALHHAAAALGKPALVIWGPFGGPEILGYPAHCNLWAPDPDLYGYVHPQEGFDKAFARIAPGRVQQAIDDGMQPTFEVFGDVAPAQGKNEAA